MATRNRLDNPGVQQTFERVPAQNAPEAVILESLHIAPWYHVQRAFELDQALAAALLTFVAEDAGVAAAVYDSGYYDFDPKYAVMPGNPAGAVVDGDWSDIYAVVNAGTSAQRALELNAPRQEVDIINRMDPAVSPANVVITDQGSYVGTAGIGEREVTFPGVDFTLLLANYTLPGPEAPVPTLEPSLPNHLSEDYFYVEFEGAEYEGRLCRVIAIQETPAGTPIPDTLIVADDMFIPDSAGIRARLVYNPRHYEWIEDSSGDSVAQAAERPVYQWTLDNTNIGNVCELDGGLHTTLLNFDVQNSVAVTFDDQLPAVAGLSVDIVFTPATDSVAITVNLGGDGATVTPALNTVALVNQAIKDAMQPYSRIGECPYQFTAAAAGFDREDCAQDPALHGTFDQLTTLAVPKAIAVKQGAIAAVATGEIGNGYQVTFQVGVNAAPSVERVEDHWIISLGTVNANNTVTAINTDLEGSGGLITLTGFLTPAVDTIGSLYNVDPNTTAVGAFSMGTLRSHAGYVGNVFDPNIQTGYLHGGVAIGGAMIYGGLLPHYDEDAPNTVQVPFYAQYRSLLVGLSAGASTTLTGNRPQVTRMRLSDYEDIVGEVSVDNPMGLVANEYFQSSGGRQAYFLGVNEVSDAYPWGTEDAVDGALAFAGRRDLYHIYVYNDAEYTQMSVQARAIDIGGEAFAVLKRPQRFYLPIKTVDSSPDSPRVVGAEAAEIGALDLVLDRDLGDDELLVPADVTAKKYVLQFAKDADNDHGDVTLQNGTTAYAITAKNVGGSPYRVTLGDALTGAIAGGPTHDDYTIFRIGESLLETDGTFKAQEGADALYDHYRAVQHRRMTRHLADEYEGLLSGVWTLLDGVYLLAKFAGMVASQQPHLPVSTWTYPNTRGLRGATDYFLDDHLDQIAGAGVTIAEQKGESGNGPVYVRDDISADVTDEVSIRRTAGVSEDKLTIEIDRLIKPKMGPHLVTGKFVDRAAMDLGLLLDTKKGEGDDREFKVIDLISVVPLTTELKAALGLNRGGILIIIAYSHLEQATIAYARHIVSPAE